MNCDVHSYRVVRSRVIRDDGVDPLRDAGDAGAPLPLGAGDEVVKHCVWHVVEPQQVAAVGLQAKALLVLRGDRVLHRVRVDVSCKGTGVALLTKIHILLSTKTWPKVATFDDVYLQ